MGLCMLTIFSKRDNCYSLRGHEVTAIRRYNSRFMKDSLAYRGSMLWNLVNYNDKTTNVSFKELKKRLTTRDTREYFKDFIFDGTAVSASRHRVSDYVYLSLRRNGSCNLTRISYNYTLSQSEFCCFRWRLSGRDNRKRKLLGNETSSLFSRPPNKASFPTRTSLTVAFALFQWSLGREWYSGNVYTGSAGQRLFIVCLVFTPLQGNQSLCRSITYRKWLKRVECMWYCVSQKEPETCWPYESEETTSVIPSPLLLFCFPCFASTICVICCSPKNYTQISDFLWGFDWRSKRQRCQ